MGGVKGKHALLQTPEISRQSLESGDCPSQGSVSHSPFPVSYPEETTSISSLSLSREKKSIYALSCHVATFQGLLVTFINFPFFFCFVSVKPSGALKRSLTLFQVFFLKAKDECPGKEPCQTPQGHGMLGI